MPQFKLNYILLPMKGHYFLWGAAAASLLSFMSVYAKQLGFDSFVVGIIYTILPLAAFLIKPLVGVIADKFRCRKLVFLIIQFIYVIGIFLMFFLPSVPSATNTRVVLTCDNSKVTLHSCDVADRCTLERLKDSGFYYDILCKVNCSLQSENWETKCEFWNNDEYCGNHPQNFSFTVNVPIQQSSQNERCVYFQVENITFGSGKAKYAATCSAPRNISTTCDIECDSPEINSLLRQTNFDDNNIFIKHQFWCILIVFTVIWICDSVIMSIGNTICFQLLGDAPHKYGIQRLFATLGGGTFPIIVGLLVDYFSNNSVTKNYSPIFGMGICLLLLSILVSSKIKYTQIDGNTNVLRDVARTLSSIPVIVFGTWCIFVGVSMTPKWNFLFWLLDELAADQGCSTMEWIKTIEGLNLGIQCLGSELLFYFFSGWILDRIRLENAMSIVLLLQGITYTSYSALSNPWMVLSIELCTGFTIALFYATMASHASAIAPPGSAATLQCIVGALFECGISLGGILAGTLSEKYGISKSFRIFGIAGFAACVFHVVVQILIQIFTRNVAEAKYRSPEGAMEKVQEDV